MRVCTTTILLYQCKSCSNKALQLLLTLHVEVVKLACNYPEFFTIEDVPDCLHYVVS